MKTPLLSQFDNKMYILQEAGATASHTTCMVSFTYKADAKQLTGESLMDGLIL